MIREEEERKVRHVKASTWILENELETINRLKGDISVSLFIKRAIRKAIAEENIMPSGSQATNQDPRAATPSEAALRRQHPKNNQGRLQRNNER